MKEFINSFNHLSFAVYKNAVKKGWWKKKRNEGEILALIHSELSEALDAVRNGNPPDDKIPLFNGIEAELADVIIRIMDYAKGFNYKVSEAVIAKIKMNETRPYKHGRKEF